MGRLLKNKKTIALLLIIVVFSAMVFYYSKTLNQQSIEPVQAQAAYQQPHLYPRVSPNLVTNPNIDGSNNWILRGDAEYDITDSRTNDGSGSLKITGLWNQNGFDSSLIYIDTSKTYTFSYYIKSDEFPSNVGMSIQVYDISGRHYRTAPGSIQSITKPNAWQETVVFYTPKPQDVYVIMRFYRGRFQTESSVWIDDVYFGEGISFEQSPSEKKPFDGAYVKVDSLGNIERLKDGEWEWFFPICIYSNFQTRSDYSIYSNQGFNCIMDATAWQSIQPAVDAGMMGSLGIGGYAMSNENKYDGIPNPNYNKIAGLEKKLNDLKDQGLMDDILWYYWDNENNFDEWEVPIAVTNKIKEIDVDENGKRLHPIYVLQGTEGVARQYLNDLVSMTDVVGDYVGMGNFGGAAGGSDGLVILDNIEEQINPVVVAQINCTTGRDRTIEEMRKWLYQSIILGAKAMGFFRDGGTTCAPVDTYSFWPEFPQLVNEIQQMLPIIREPHWTSWSLDSSLESVTVGTRDYNGEGYVILVNRENSPATTSFTISGLSYTPLSVDDYFTGNTIAAMTGLQFSVTIPAYGTAVYRLVKGGEPSCLPPDLNCDNSINSADLNILKSNWGQITSTADFNQDSFINTQDFGIMMSGWGNY